ncbi:transposase, partial [Streptomyces griseomycini]
MICDGRGTPLKVITTAVNVNDVTQALALVNGVPPVAGRPGRPRRRPEALLGDKGYDSNPNRANCGNVGSCRSSTARALSRCWVCGRLAVCRGGVGPGSGPVLGPWQV